MNTRIKPVRGKVARVLNERQVAINRGSDDGVEVGMKFSILNSDRQEIRDPDTGETLGHVDRAKIPVRVTAVHDRIAVATTFRFRRVNIAGRGFGISAFIPPKWRKRYETLQENGAKFNGDSDFSKQVAVGDPVVQVIEAKEEARLSATT